MNSRILDRRGIECEELFRALASGTRLKIIGLLAEREMNINELSQSLGLMQPTVSKNVQMLEQAGLVTSEYMSGDQGTQKRCRLRYDRLLFSLDSIQTSDSQVEEMEMPIGLYNLAHVSTSCGLAGREKFIGLLDEPQSFLLPERAEAQLLWMANGFVEYVFPNAVPTSMEILRSELSMEICSESTDFNNDYPSDITVWINGVELGSWTSPGDMGGRRGRFNPPWWPDRLTQYGFLKVWSVDQEGSYADGQLISETRIQDVMIAPRQPITVRIGIKPDAVHVGGFNLFGRGFGNYEQNITLRLYYQLKNSHVHRVSAPGTSLGKETQTEISLSKLI